MQGYAPSQQELDALIRFINGEDASVLEGDAVDRLFSFTRSVERALEKYAKDTLRRNRNMAARLDDLRNKKIKEYEAGNYTCLEYDSLALARAITYCLKAQHQYCTKLKVNLILYHCYCSWLYRYGERLTMESPVAQEKGPWFWKVMKDLEIPQNAPTNWLSDVGGYNPGLREYLKNATAKYGAYSEDDLAKAALQSRPYRNAHKDNNGGKWNKPINDRDIYIYQKSIKK